jgi:probable phosphoglycerate mutase
MELLLIRHGLPIRIESDQPVDPPLAPLGHRQAQALADWLAPLPPDRLISSTMARAVDTADHLAQTLALEPVADADFCEFDRGAKAYIPLEELDRDHPHMQQLIDDWIGPGGAPRREVFQARVLEALRRQLDGIDAERPALVCHGGVINVILADVLGTDRMMFFQPDYTSVSRLAVHGSSFRLLSINETAHLRGIGDPS